MEKKKTRQKHSVMMAGDKNATKVKASIKKLFGFNGACSISDVKKKKKVLSDTGRSGYVWDFTLTCNSKSGK